MNTMSNAVILRGAVNTVATQVYPCEPWNFEPSIPPEVLASKIEFAKWRSQPSSEHLVYTAYEGVNPNIRVNNKTNPVRKMHAIVMDYDALITDTERQTILDRCPADMRPNWLSRSFSKGVRLVYLFEEPLAMECGPLTEQFLKIAYKELRLQKLFAGPDEGAFQNVSLHYDVGYDWQKIDEKPLASNLLNYWLTEASKKTKWHSLGELSIPIEKVAAEVNRQFPGRWEGEFEVGNRGVVFFDPSSKNPTAAIVTDAGMMCFGQAQSFYPWAQIFGGSFVREFQADKIGAAVNKVWYDGRAYYMKSAYGVWEPHSREDFAIKLKVNHGIDAAKQGREVASEMDRTLNYVLENRRVSGVVPKVYDKEEILYFNGRRFLNCAAVTTMEPSDNKVEWGENFPWLANFLDTCWDAALVPCITPGKPAMDAKTIFLAWWKRFYCTAHAGDLKKGQALFLAGGANRGKSLLATIIGHSVGGSADASDFLNSSTSFNKELLEVGLWCIDDGVASQDPQAHLKFSEMIKRAVANPRFNYHVKYRDAQSMEWHGRVVTTLNDDASAIRILPQLDDNIIDKLIVLAFADTARQFPDWHELRDIIASELPFLLRWLIEWTPPAEVMGEKRFGVNSYIHEELRAKSMHAGGVSDLLEIVELWIKRREVTKANDGKAWRGTATEWLAALSADDALARLAGKFTVRQLGKKFVEASRLRGSRIKVLSGKNHGNIYEIDLTLDETEESNSEEENE